ncbi:NIF-domain-containing protein [Paxillus ammoniavirescens]|nr:NIF-domain-containing protein [Paxillus ammoniavirescens]
MGKSPDDVEPPAIDDFGNDYALQHNPPCHAPTLFRIDEEEEDAELCTQLDEGAQDLGSTLEYDTTYHFPISEKSEDDDDERDISDAATARDGSEEEEDDEDEDDEIVRNGGAGIPIGPNGIPQPLLPPITPEHAGRKCLVLDLDETLVHTTFETTAMTEFIMPVCVDGKWANACVNKRPGVDAFLQKMGEIYEVVVFTASISQYADPVISKLDVHHAISHRLYRESCYPYKGNYIKDLSRLGRPMSSVIIVDNIALSYYFQPNNGIPVNTWTNDPTDTELETLSVFLTDLATVPDVRGVLDRSLGPR